MGNGLVFSSDFADESAALDAFVQNLDGRRRPIRAFSHSRRGAGN